MTSFGIDKRHVFASDKTITSIVAFALFIRHVASFTSFVSIFYRTCVCVCTAVCVCFLQHLFRAERQLLVFCLPSFCFVARYHCCCSCSFFATPSTDMCSCLPGSVCPSLSLSSPLSLCMCVLSARQLCAVYARLGHTPCSSRGSSSTSCHTARTIFAFVTNFKWIFLSPFPALPHSFSYFLCFCTRNSLRLRLRFVTFWPGIIWLWLWLWLHPHALDKYLLDLYLYCLFCAANCLPTACSPFSLTLPAFTPFFSLPFSSPSASLLAFFFVNSFVLGLSKLLCHVCQILCHACSATLKCQCCLPHATCNCSSSSNDCAAAAHCGRHYYGWLFGWRCHRAV